MLVPDPAHLMPLDAPAAISGRIRDFVRLTATQSASRPTQRTLYLPGTVRDLLGTDLVTEPTRSVLTERIARAPAESGVFFQAGPFRTLSAACARIIPQWPDGETVDIAGEIDMRLSRGEGNGWRYAELPTDGEAYRLGLNGLDETAHNQSGILFANLDPADQDALLFAVQQNRVAGGAWDLISPSRFFEEFLAEASEIYFSHPVAQERIGYAGMADMRGWQPITLNHAEGRGLTTLVGPSRFQPRGTRFEVRNPPATRLRGVLLRTRSNRSWQGVSLRGSSGDSHRTPHINADTAGRDAKRHASLIMRRNVRRNLAIDPA